MASVIGLLGTDGGLVWVVAGVWTVRSMAGGPVGYAWGLACLGVGLRWGTLGLGDLQVATRLVGSTVASGTVAVRVGMVVALIGAIVGEAQVGGFRARTWGERSASAVAVATLVPLFAAPGPLEPVWQAVAWRALPVAGATFVVLIVRPLAERIGRAAPVVATAAGVVVALAGS